jgi:thiamine biosynthesis lipoprotein ApbE
MSPVTVPVQEASEHFDCFGGHCTVVADGRGAGGSAHDAAGSAKRRLLEWQAQFSRFEAESELSQLNNDRRECVPVSAMMLRFVDAALWAASVTGGLVDPTLVTEVEQAGYMTDFSKPPVSRELAARLTPAPQAAGPRPPRAGVRSK